jgi:hypothetical protein
MIPGFGWRYTDRRAVRRIQMRSRPILAVLMVIGLAAATQTGARSLSPQTASADAGIAWLDECAVG